MKTVQKDVNQVAFFFLLLLLVALLGTTLWYPGTADVSLWLDRIELARNLGIVEGYKTNPADYAPASYLFFRIVAYLGDAGIGDFKALKVSLVLFSLFSGYLLSKLQKDRLVVLVGFLYFWYMSVNMGYVDIVYAPFVLLAIFAFYKGNFLMMGVCLGIATTFKWQPILLLPLFVLWALLKGRSLLQNWRFLARLLTPFFVIMAVLFLIFGIPYLQSLRYALSHSRYYLSANALNVHWLTTSLLEMNIQKDVFIMISSLQEPPKLLLSVSRLVFFFLGSLLLLSFVFATRNLRTRAEYVLAFPGLYFTLATGAHENHLFVAALAAMLMPRNRNVGILVCLFSAVNVLVFYGTGAQSAVVHRLGWGIDLTIILAVFNTAFFSYIACRLIFENMNENKFKYFFKNFYFS